MAAQPLRPFCNVVSFTVVAEGPFFSLSGTDDRCGAGEVGAVSGTAALQADGTVVMGLTIVADPGVLIAAAALRLRPAEDLRVLTDRRHADRRVVPAFGVPASPWAPASRRQGFTEQRRTERRQPLAATWETLALLSHGIEGDAPLGSASQA